MKAHLRVFALAAPLALAMAVFATPASACTLAAVSVEGAQVALTYDPFTPAAPSASVPLRIQTSGDCNGRSVEVSVAPDVGNPSPAALQLFNGSHTLPVQIEDRTGRSVLALSNLTFAPNRTARLPIGANGEVSNSDALTLGIEPGLATQSGEYLGRARVLVRFTDDAHVLAAPFDISAIVIPSVGLAAAGDMRLDLGEVRRGARAQTRFVAYANTDYELNIRSDNGWAIRSGGASGPGIPYALSVSGREVRQDANDAQVPFHRPRSDGRRVHEMVVTVPSAHNALAGEYKDYVTIEISARL